MNFLKIAAISAAIAIALGAFGSHALNDRLVAEGMLEAWKTAVLYHLVHSVALFSLAFRSGGIQSRQSTLQPGRGWQGFYSSLDHSTA